MASTGRWTRRRFLRAAGLGTGAAALLPYVPLLRATAQEVGSPRRLVLFTSTNGTVLSEWRSNGAGTSFPAAPGSAVLPPLRGQMLAPLDAVRSRLLLVDGLDLQSGYLRNDSNALQKGHAGTGLLWSGARGGPPVDSTDGWSKTASIDHLVAARIGPQRRVPVLHLGSFPVDVLNAESVHSFDAPLHPYPYENDARQVFDRLWGGGGGADAGTGDAAALARRRQRVLTESRAQLARLRPQLIEEDRARLDAHEEALARLQERLSVPPGTCPQPTGGYRRHDISEQHLATDWMLELGRLALQCDLTRVFHFVFMREGNGGGAAFLPGFGNSNVHSVSHLTQTLGADGNTARQRIGSLQAYVAGKLARFWQDLGPTAASTLAVWGMSMSHPGVHNSRNIPFVLLQGAELSYFAVNRYVRLSSYAQDSSGHRVGGGNDYVTPAAPPHNHLLVSICQAMGMQEVQDVGGLKGQLPSGPLTQARA